MRELEFQSLAVSVKLLDVALVLSRQPFAIAIDLGLHLGTPPVVLGLQLLREAAVCGR